MTPREQRFLQGLHYFAKSLHRRFPAFTISEIDRVLEETVSGLAPCRCRTQIHRNAVRTLKTLEASLDAHRSGAQDNEGPQKPEDLNG